MTQLQLKFLDLDYKIVIQGTQEDLKPRELNLKMSLKSKL